MTITSLCDSRFPIRPTIMTRQAAEAILKKHNLPGSVVYRVTTGGQVVWMTYHIDHSVSTGVVFLDERTETVTIRWRRCESVFTYPEWSRRLLLSNIYDPTMVFTGEEGT